MKDIISEIRKSSLFYNATDQEIRAFIQAHPCKIVEYNKNECIITREETSKHIAVVLDGTLGIYSDSYYGGHTLIGIGSRHYLFGFIAMFYNQAHSITSLYCRGFCRIAYFNVPNGQTAVEFIRTTPPQILSNAYEMLTKHIRDDFDRVHFVSSASVSVKLARYLLHLRSEAGEDSFVLPMNRTELSNFLGVYRTSLSREINRMIQKKIISCTQNSVSILDPQSLIQIEISSYE